MNPKHKMKKWLAAQAYLDRVDAVWQEIVEVAGASLQASIDADPDFLSDERTGRDSWEYHRYMTYSSALAEVSRRTGLHPRAHEEDMYSLWVAAREQEEGCIPLHLVTYDMHDRVKLRDRYGAAIWEI